MKRDNDKLYDRSISTFRENGKTIGLIGLTIPLLLENTFVLLYGTVSTLILSGYADAAVSAAGVAQQVINIAVAALNMVSKGTVIIQASPWGRRTCRRCVPRPEPVWCWPLG